MQTIEVYKVIESYDFGPNKTLGLFSRESDALAVVLGKLDLSVYHEVLVIYDTVTEYQNDLTEAIRSRALSKLTKEERQALGFA